MNQQADEFMVKKLTVEKLELILALQETVIQSLPDKRILQPLSEEEFIYILNGNGLMIGLFDHEKLISFRALLAPVADMEDHLGKDMGLSDDELEHVIYQEMSVVHPEYRGRGLQKKMAAFIMEELQRADHPYRYVCCTVAPFNIPSLKDKFAQEMKIVSLKEKYGGPLRYTFVKQIDEPLTPSSATVSARMADTKRQQELLNQGFYGVGLELEKNEWFVLFAHKN